MMMGTNLQRPSLAYLQLCGTFTDEWEPGCKVGDMAFERNIFEMYLEMPPFIKSCKDQQACSISLLGFPGHETCFNRDSAIRG